MFSFLIREHISVIVHHVALQVPVRVVTNASVLERLFLVTVRASCNFPIMMI